MKRRWLVAVVVVFTLCSAAMAESPKADKKAESKLTAVVEGLDCSTPAGPGTFAVQSWSFGASNPVVIGGGGGGGTGKVSVSDFNIQKSFDPCSPALFGAVISGKHYKTLTFTQSQPKDGDTLIAVMSDVLVTSYQIGGSEASEYPFESLSFAFAKICITETSSGSKLCYDSKLQ
jgi:type VI secretion system secreted protein Hcp